MPEAQNGTITLCNGTKIRLEDNSWVVVDSSMEEDESDEDEDLGNFINPVSNIVKY